MLQEIAPHHYHPEYESRAPQEADLVCVFDGRDALIGEGRYPTVAEVRALGVTDDQLTYLFRVDDRVFYLLREVTDTVRAGLVRTDINACRRMAEPYMTLVGATALHLHRWYRAHRFCGACGAPAVHDKNERMMRCPVCGQMMFPQIMPAVVVAIRSGDRILLTKYADRETPRYALVAGFVEIGETLEDTAHREVMEEVGLKLKNLKYQGNQPWGFSNNQMFGFWADVEGDDTIHMDATELREAVWMDRENVPATPHAPDLTHTMMEMFRLGFDPR